ncbi:MAG: hypothetical protein IIB32_07000, partial [Chloroflexi bacterium]|nr:hypothetical protein [Chloroflexota bacterium]
MKSKVKSQKSKEVPAAQEGKQEKSEVALREEEVLKFWKDNDIFEKSVETPAGK